MKGTVKRREFKEYEEGNEDYELYGGDLMAKKCSAYGQYYTELGDELCMMICPEDWNDYGILCEKPKKYQRQHVFTYYDVVNNEAVDQ